MKKHYPGIVWSGPSGEWPEVVESLLDETDLVAALSDKKQVVIKPNLVEALEPPITTPVGLVMAIAGYLKKHCPATRVIVAEGTGSLEYDTFHCFDRLGYTDACKSAGIELIDLNSEPVQMFEDESCERWPEMYLPKLLFDSFLISVPVLKAHSMSQVTLTMKNMMGCAPPAHYRSGGSWGKSSFHRLIHEAIFDLNRYRTADFTVLDASVGMAKAHLWGPTCNPPVGKIAAAYDPVALDAYGAFLLGRSWQNIEYIRMAHGLLGRAEPLEVREKAFSSL